MANSVWPTEMAQSYQLSPWHHYYLFIVIIWERNAGYCKNSWKVEKGTLKCAAALQ
jgi:hypothetical protein